MGQIIIPYKPRNAFWKLHDRQQRWAVVVAHRRAGKTVACINELIKAALIHKVSDGRFAYVAPFYRQAKAIAWDYLKRYSAPIPNTEINESELRIDYPNGSRIQLFGADNYDAMRGLGFDGLVADEYGDWKPSVWGYVIRPALADRRGWAIIIGTPKGHNQFFETYQQALTDPEWLALTLRASETGILPAEELASLKSELTDDAWRQEMECDFDAALPGAIFGKEIWQATNEGRIRKDLYDPSLKTFAALDLGFSDDTAIWWFQVGKELRLIDCYSAHGMPIAHYHEVLKAKPYKYGEWLYVPHDARAKSLQTGRSIEQQLTALGWKPRIVPELSVMDGIQAARLTLATCFIDTQCDEGIEALKQYQREYDEDKRCFRDRPRHDWTSHYCLHPQTYILTRIGMCQIMNLPYTGEVLTSCGWKKYLNPRITRRNARLVAVQFSDGLMVKCTREHLFKTVSGWKSADSLMPNMLIQSSLTLLPSILMAAYIVYGRAKNIFPGVVRNCIVQFGNQLSEKFQQAVTFTISTIMHPIMRLRILNVYRPQNISENVDKQILMGLVTSLAKKRLNGINQMPDDSGINAMLNAAKHGQNGAGKKRTVRSVASLLMRWLGKVAIVRFIVTLIARPRRVVSVKNLDDISDVWCITVPDSGEFSLSNGAIVHNSDAFRYSCLVWREEMKPKETPKPRWAQQQTINELIKARSRAREG